MSLQATQPIDSEEPAIIANAVTEHNHNTLILLLSAASVLIILIVVIILLVTRANNQIIDSDNSMINTPSPVSTIAVTATVNVTETNNQTVCGSSLDTLVLNNEIIGKSNQQIDELLAERWLSQFKSVSRCMIERLDDYRIEKVVVRNADMFELTYAVSPSDQQSSDWFAGNGVLEGSFIVHKFAFVNISHTNTGIGVESANTGP